MRLPFGEYSPDIPPLVNGGGLISSLNARPIVGGYEPTRDLAAIPNATALSARPVGALSGIDVDGNGYLYAGDVSKLYVQRDSGIVDISRSSGYTLGSTDRWSFTRFGSRIYAATPSTVIQQHQVGSPDAFADLSLFAPNARHIATIGNFLFAGNIYDPIEGPMPDTVTWPAINNPLNWPDLRTDDAAQFQADRQPLEGNGGWIQDIVSGAEVGVVFQERAIHRFDPIGGADIFRKNRVEEGNGMFVPHSAVAFGRQVFYIAEDGFRIFDLVTSHPIGNNRASATFLADLDGAYLDRVGTAKDPDRNEILTAYPGANNTSGRPNKLIRYDYVLDRFSDGTEDLEALIQNATTSALSIDAPASSGDPDDVDDVTGEDSFDDRQTTFGSSRMGAFSTTFVANDFSGALREAVLETGDIEGAPGQFFWIESIRPLVYDRKVEIAVSEREFLSDDDPSFGPYNIMDLDGTIPIRSEARYHRLRIKLPAGWQNAVGVDIMGQPSGGR